MCTYDRWKKGSGFSRTLDLSLLFIVAVTVSLSVGFLFQDTFNKIVGPHDVLSFNNAEMVSKVHVQNPVFDYVPPDLITLFVSNM